MDVFSKPGVKWVHSFDLWGPIIKENVIGERQIELYRQIMKGKLPPETIEEVVKNYRAVNKRDPEAIEHKTEYLKALKDPIRKSGLAVSYKGGYFEDGLATLRDILDTGEGVIIIASEPDPHAVANLPEDIRQRIGNFYHGSKKIPDIFRQVYDQESKQNRRVISHTNDEIKELESAIASGVFQKGNLIYIDRDKTFYPMIMENILSRGMRYTRDLRDIEYSKLTKI